MVTCPWRIPWSKIKDEHPYFSIFPRFSPLKLWTQAFLRFAVGTYFVLTSLYCLLAYLPYTFFFLIKSPPYAWMPWFVHHQAALVLDRTPRRSRFALEFPPCVLNENPTHSRLRRAHHRRSLCHVSSIPERCRKYSCDLLVESRLPASLAHHQRLTAIRFKGKLR